jgi:hypothetical protein
MRETNKCMAIRAPIATRLSVRTSCGMVTILKKSMSFGASLEFDWDCQKQPESTSVKFSLAELYPLLNKPGSQGSIFGVLTISAWVPVRVFFSEGQEERVLPHPQGFHGAPIEPEDIQKVNPFLRKNAPSSVPPLSATPIRQGVRGAYTLSLGGPTSRVLFTERPQSLVLTLPTIFSLYHLNEEGETDRAQEDSPLPFQGATCVPHLLFMEPPTQLISVRKFLSSEQPSVWMGTAKQLQVFKLFSPTGIHVADGKISQTNFLE